MSSRSASLAWDFLGQLAEKSGQTALLLDIIRNRNALFWWESRCKSLMSIDAFSTCKAVDAGSIPTPASNRTRERPLPVSF
jgi:hypothetical protein